MARHSVRSLISALAAVNVLATLLAHWKRVFKPLSAPPHRFVHLVIDSGSCVHRAVLHCLSRHAAASALNEALRTNIFTTIVQLLVAEVRRLAPLLPRTQRITIVLDGALRAAASERLDTKQVAAQSIIQKASRQQRHHLHTRTLSKFVILPASVLHQLQTQLQPLLQREFPHIVIDVVCAGSGDYAQLAGADAVASELYRQVSFWCFFAFFASFF